jgi:hypothetical protein
LLPFTHRVPGRQQRATPHKLHLAALGQQIGWSLGSSQNWA